MPRPALAISVVTAAVLVVGCGSPSARSTTDPPAVTASPSTSGAASATATPTATATATATPTPGTVPVDQIPPGRPARWIPAGMPTVAPWKEPGDVLPTFTPTMFKPDLAGAQSMARYFVLARNWALATLDPAAYLIVCDAANCQQNAQRQRALRSLGQHLVGGRGQIEDVLQRPAPAWLASDSRIVRLTISLGPGRLVDSTGRLVEADPASLRKLDLDLRWNGKMWRIADVGLVMS